VPEIIDGEYEVLDDDGPVTFLDEAPIPPGEVYVGESDKGIFLDASDIEELIKDSSLVNVAQEQNPQTLDILAEAFPSLRPGIDEAKHERLLLCKDDITNALRISNSMMMFVAGKVLLIERERLYEAEINQRTGEPYKSMYEYYPDLLDELRSTVMHKLSKRQVQAYVAIHKVLVEGLGVTTDTIEQIGVSNATELLEATDYNPRTGQVAEEPRPGKLGKVEVLDMLAQIADEAWDYKQTRQALGEARGVMQRTVHVNWEPSGIPKGSTLALTGITIFEDGVPQGYMAYKPELAEWLTKKLGATSNLEEL